MFKIAICDDEKLFCAELENFLLELENSSLNIETLDVFYSGEKLIENLDNGNGYDLIFLDIEMDGLNGIEVGHKIRTALRDYNTKIVYVSGSQGYDRQLFQLQPFDFIEKPVSKEKITQVLKLAIDLSETQKPFFTYKKGQDIYKFQLKDIVSFESRGREIKIITIQGEDYFYEKLTEVMKRIESNRFLRIHNSILVNYDYVLNVKYNYIVMSNGKQFDISQSRRSIIRSEISRLVSDI